MRTKLPDVRRLYPALLKAAAIIKAREAKRRLAGKQLDGSDMGAYTPAYAARKGKSGRSTKPNLFWSGKMAGSVGAKKWRKGKDVGVKLAPSKRERLKAMSHQFPKPQFGGYGRGLTRRQRDVLGLNKGHIDAIMPILGKAWHERALKDLEVRGQLDLQLG